MSFETFPSNNQVENNENKNHDKQMQDLLFILNRSYDQTGGDQQVWLPDNLNQYPDLSHLEIAKAMIDNQYLETVKTNLDKFNLSEEERQELDLYIAGQGDKIAAWHWRL